MPENADRGRVVIAGGSGFLRLSLATHLTSKGWSVAILSRNPPGLDGPWSHFRWDARTLGEWSQVLEGSHGLVNLVGRTVDCVKTPDRQDEILRSRTEATRVLRLAVRAIKAPPPAAVGFGVFDMSNDFVHGGPPPCASAVSPPKVSFDVPPNSPRWFPLAGEIIANTFAKRFPGGDKDMMAAGYTFSTGR